MVLYRKIQEATFSNVNVLLQERRDSSSRGSSSEDSEENSEEASDLSDSELDADSYYFLQVRLLSFILIVSWGCDALGKWVSCEHWFTSYFALQVMIVNYVCKGELLIIKQEY